MSYWNWNLLRLFSVLIYEAGSIRLVIVDQQNSHMVPL